MTCALLQPHSSSLTVAASSVLGIWLQALNCCTAAGLGFQILLQLHDEEESDMQLGLLIVSLSLHLSPLFPLSLPVSQAQS